MAIKKIVEIIRRDFEYDNAPTFREEVARQCNAVVIPASLMALFSWIFYIPLDQELYREIPQLLFLRLGLCLVGGLTFGLHFFPYFRDKGYHLIIVLMFYLGFATAVILGMVSADPIYMGGFSIVILMFTLAPLRLLHSYILLFSTLLIFFVTGQQWDMEFKEPSQMYGLYNVLASTVIAIIVIYVFDWIRRNSYNKSIIIKRTNRELEEANKIKGELLAIAAHDLKDPLQVIIGYTDLLQMRLQGDAFASDRLNKIYRSTDRMLKLITGLLELTSIESGKLVLKKMVVDLAEIATTIIANQQFAANLKGQDIIFQSKNQYIVRGDETLLQQVMENLLSNAIKFSPKGKKIHLDVTRKNEKILFAVKDEGPGLTPLDKSKLFEKFQRLSAKPTGDETSTGLGLALAWELVKLHNGTIKVISEIGKGSEFIVELPSAKSYGFE
ncbi:MAG: HAMP domain-containing histidine kinase [bacterium]|nr:HAMP domain-containing histidine kinase [bacterium]